MAELTFRGLQFEATFWGIMHVDTSIHIYLPFKLKKGPISLFISLMAWSSPTLTTTCLYRIIPQIWYAHCLWCTGTELAPCSRHSLYVTRYRTCYTVVRYWHCFRDQDFPQWSPETITLQETQRLVVFETILIRPNLCFSICKAYSTKARRVRYSRIARLNASLIFTNIHLTFLIELGKPC